MLYWELPGRKALGVCRPEEAGSPETKYVIFHVLYSPTKGKNLSPIETSRQNETYPVPDLNGQNLFADQKSSKIKHFRIAHTS